MHGESARGFCQTLSRLMYSCFKAQTFFCVLALGPQQNYQEWTFSNTLSKVKICEKVNLSFQWSTLNSWLCFLAIQGLWQRERLFSVKESTSSRYRRSGVRVELRLLGSKELSQKLNFFSIGVPQELILGFLLFVHYMNDFLSVACKFSVRICCWLVII